MCQRRLAHVCFIYKTAFEKHLDNNNFCCDIYFYKANTKNLDNLRDKIPLFKLYNVTRYISLCYHLTKEYKLEKVRLE